MKRILSMVLAFAMVFTTFGPSVYATGEGLAEIINDEAVVEQVEQPAEEITVEETVTEEPANNVEGYAGIYINAGGEEEYNPANGGFGTSQDSGFDIIFRDSNGNNISTSNVVMSEEGKFVLMEDGIRPTDNGDRYHIQTSDWTPEGTYTAYFTVNGTYAEVQFTVSEFVFEGYNFAEDAESEVPVNGKLTVPVVKTTDRALTFDVKIGYMDDSFVPFDSQSGVSVDVAKGTCTFNGAEIAKDPHALERGGFYAYVYSYENGNEVACINKYFNLVNNSSNDGVYYSKDGQNFTKFEGKPIKLGLDEEAYLYVLSQGTKFTPDNISRDNGGSRMLDFEMEDIGLEADVLVISWRTTPYEDEAYGYLINVAGTSWAFSVAQPFESNDDSINENSKVYFKDDYIHLPARGKQIYDVGFSLHGSEGNDVAIGVMDYEANEFVPFNIQVGIRKIYNDMGHITQVEFDVGTISEAYPQVVEQGWLTAGCYIVNGGNRQLSGVTAVHLDGFCDGNCGNYGDFDGKVIWRYAGDSDWNVVSNGSNSGDVEVELFSHIQIVFYNAENEKVLPTFAEQLPDDFRVVFHEEDKIMNLFIDSSRWDDSMEPIDFIIEDQKYTLNLSMDYGEPPINTLLPFEGSASAIVGEHNNPEYVEFDNFHPEAKEGAAFGVQFYDENGAIAPERVRPILGTKHGTLEIHYGQDGNYEAWEIWFNQDYVEHDYTVQFVIDNTYLAEVEFTSSEPANDVPANKFSGTVEWRYAGDTQWKVLSDGTYSNGDFEVEAFKEIELRFIHWDMNVSGNVLYIPNNSDYSTSWYNRRSETDGEYVMVFQACSYDLIGERHVVDLSVDMHHYQFGFTTNYSKEDFTGEFTGTVNWRVAGETQWKPASSGVSVTPKGAIQLDLFEVLELQFLDENGNEVRGDFTWRGRSDGQVAYGIVLDGGNISYEAVSNSSTGLMRDADGYQTLVVGVVGEQYILKYKLNNPQVNDPSRAFNGYAMAVTGPEDDLVYTSFDNFCSIAENYNYFGIQFFDENDNPVDSSRVQLLDYNMDDGFDIRLSTDRDWENAQWQYDNWEVVFNNEAHTGTYTVYFLIDGTYLAEVTFDAEGEDGGDDGDRGEFMFWFSDTGNDGDWARMYEGRRQWLDVDRPFYFKVTDFEGNLVDNDRISEVYTDGEECTWYNNNDDVAADGELCVDRYEFDIHIEDLDGDEGSHIHFLTFVIDGNEYSIPLIVGHDPMYFWLNWDWDYYVKDGPFTISKVGTTDVDIIEHTQRPGWTAEIEIGQVMGDEFVAADVQTGFEIVDTYRQGVPKTVRFDGAKIIETYEEIMDGENFHINISFYDENGDYHGQTGTDVRIANVIGGYEFELRNGRLIIWKGPEFITAENLKAAFGSMADEIDFIVFRGYRDCYEDSSKRIEGKEILKAFPKVYGINVFGFDYIDDYAFANNTKLTYADINDIGEFGDSVFSGCRNLDNVYLSNVGKFGVNTFKGCTELKSAGTNGYGWFDIKFENIWIEEDGRWINRFPENMLIGSSVKELNVKNYTHLSKDAFKGLNLDSLVMDQMVEVIDYAFTNSTIDTVYYQGDKDQFDAQITINGDFAYQNLVDNYVYVIDEGNAGTYYGDWEYGDEVKYTYYSDGQLVFSGNGAIGDAAELYVENYDGWTYIEAYSPWTHYTAERVVIEHGVTGIGDGAFAGLWLHEVIIPDTVTTIGDYVFANGGITQMVMPNSITHAGNGVFEGTDQIETIWFGGIAPQWGALFGTGDMAAQAVIPESTTTVRIPDYAIEEANMKLKMEGDERIAYEFTDVPVGSSFHLVPTMGITAAELWVNGYLVHGDFFTPNVNGDIGISFAQPEPISGKAGANATWTYDDGELVISGTGATYNYDFYDKYTAGSAGMAPWADLWIDRIIVKEGITALGDSNILPTCLEMLKLPSTLKTIGKWNFVGVEMEEIVFPENLTAIGSDSFNETAINRIVFNDKLTTIGRESFQNMHSCTFSEVVGNEVVRNYIDITIPASVTSIGEGAFTNGGYEREYYNEDGNFIGSFTSTLRSITVDPANKNYKVENGALLTKDGKTFIALPAAANVHYGQYIPVEDYYLYDEFDGIYTVPDGVETLGYRALSSHNTITGINLPNTLKKANERAFSNLGIRNIVLPDNLTTLAENVFELCGDLEAVQLGKNIKTINKNAFNDCESLERIDIRKDNPYLASEDGFVTSKDGKILYMVTSDAYRWNYMEELYVIVPYGVTTIAAGAFEDMYQIRGIELPGSVTTIQKNAFKGTDNLTKIIIPASVKSVDPTAFVWSGIQEGMWGITGNNETVMVEEGTVYYGGTYAQWNAIASKINPQNVVTNCMPEGKLRVDSEEYTAIERKAFVLYDGETITETFEMYVEMFGNPITGEESTHEYPMLTWKMNEYGENFHVENIGDNQVQITINAPGTYEFMAYNGANPKADQVNYIYVVKDMADAVELTVANGAYTREGALVVARGASVTPKINWIDGLAWNVKGVHTTEFTFNGDSQYFTFNAATGAVKVAKDAPGGMYELTYTAERYDEEGNWIGYIDDTLEILVVEELVAGVEILNANEGYMFGAPIGNKIVLDKAKGITSFTIGAYAVNGDADYQEFAFTSTANENFTVVDNGNNTATITLIGDTGNVTVTATAMDGSKKSVKVTVTAGIAMEELHITHTLPVVEAETIPANESLTGREMHAEVVILAKGKTATLTAEMLPSAPTNKGVTWIAETWRNDEGNDSDVVEIKNGKLTTKAEGVARVVAVAQDGTPCADIVYVRVVCPAKAVELVSDIDPIRGKVDAVDGVKAGKGTITIGDEVGSVTLVAEPVGDGHVYEGVQWSISGGIAKYVTYDVTGPVYDAQGELVELPKATFYADRPGDFTVKAVADDGTNVAATYKITVAQVPYAMEVTKLSGSKGEYTTGGHKAFILKGDFTKPTTVVKATPTVVFNNGDKTDVVKAPFNSYSVYVNGERIESGKLEFTAPDIYTVRLVANHRPSTSTTFVVDVRDNSAVELESLVLSMPKGMAAGQAVAGKTYKISALLNGQAKIDTAKINVEWNVIVLNGSADNVSINNGTLDLKNANGGEAYLVQLKLTDKNDAENVIMAGLSINVKAPLVKNNLWLGLEETVDGNKVYTNITELGDRLNAVTGTLETIKVLDLDGANISSYQFDVKSSNPKVLDVEKVKNDTFNITAKDDGKVNLTISALDGSGYKQTVAVTVKAVESPVNKITVAGATSAAYTVGMQQSIVVPYGLESKVSTAAKPVSPVTSTEMAWTSSDTKVATVDNIVANEVTSVTAKNGNVTYTTNGKVVITTGQLPGKATITGTALDGSGKTVKINVTVAASGQTNEIHLSAPANAANGGQTDGTVVLTWGKNMKLTATVLPNKAKNKVINYTIEAVDENDNVTMSAAELEALGVTVNKTGTVAVKAASKALANPYVGWVKVTATLNYGFAVEEGGTWTTEAIEDTQYIFIDRPVQSIKFTTFNSQGKVVNAPTSETIKKSDIEYGPISFKLTDKYTLDFVNKGYVEKGVDLTTVESVYGTYDNLLWTTSDAKLATVDEDGTITVNQFTKAGSVKITAKAQDGSNIKYTYTIKIAK